MKIKPSAYYPLALLTSAGMAFILSGAAAIPAAPPAFGYGVLELNRPSPHTAWAKPLMGGAIRMLVLAPTMTHRETIELASRLETRVTAWMSASDKDADGTGGGLSKDAAISHFYADPATVQKSLQAAMETKYDVYVVGKLYWSAIPQAQRDEIVARVRAGAGLVYVQPAEAQQEPLKLMDYKPPGWEWIIGGVPVSRISLFNHADPKALVKIGLCSRGRIVVLNYGDPPETTHHSLTPNWEDSVASRITAFTTMKPLTEPYVDQSIAYEYAQALLIRAILWAAERTPPPSAHRLTLTMPDSIGLDGTPPKLQAETSCQYTNFKGYSLIAALRLDGARHQELGRTLLGASGGKLSAKLPILSAGRHYVDVWLKTGDSVVDWTSAAIDVTGPPICSELALDQEGLKRGAAVSGTVTLARSLEKGESAELVIVDNLGWERAKTRWDAGTAGKLPFKLEVPDSPVTRQLARLSVYRDGRLLESQERPVYLFDPAWGEDFRAVAWHMPMNSRPDLYVTGQMRALGFDVISLGCNSMVFQKHPYPLTPETASLARQIMRLRAQLTLFHNLDIINYSWSQLGDRTVSAPGYRDPELTTDAKTVALYGCYAYINSEPFAADKEFTPAAADLEVYRAYLKDVYGEIAALNASWGTQLADFAQAEYLPLAEARDKKAYAQWADFRLFMEKMFARRMADIGESFAAGDPGVRHGFDGALFHGVYDGIDIWEMSKQLSCLVPYHFRGYDDLMLAKMVCSFAAKNTITGTWNGSYGPRFGDLGPTDEQFNRYQPWSLIFNGMNSFWWWTSAYDAGPSTGNLSWTVGGTPLAHFSRTMEEVREIKAGTGRMLLAAERDDNGIAILYSPASRIGTALLPQDAEPMRRTDGTIDALPVSQDQPGFQWMQAMVGWAKMLEDVGFQYRILSAAELAGDALTGRGCRTLVLPYSVALADDEIKAVRKFAENGGVVLADRRPGIMTRHCAMRTEWPLRDLFPETTGWEARAIGQGRGVLLGSALLAYHEAFRKSGKWRESADLRATFRENFVRWTGVSPYAVVEPADGDAIPPTEITVFRRGAITCVGLLRDYQLRDDKACKAQLKLAQPACVYDVRKGKFLGRSAAVPLEISGRAKLLACLAYRVASVNVTAAQTAERGKNWPVKIALKIADSRSAGAGDHVYRVQLLDPAGKAVDGFAKNLQGSRGEADVSFFMPFNLPKGKYTLAVRDVLTGTTARQAVNVR